MTDLPAYVWVLVFLGVVGIPATTVAMLYRGAVAAGIGRRAGASLAIPAALLLGGWITASALLADGDVYHRASGEAAPWFGIAFAGSYSRYSFSPASRSSRERSPPRHACSPRLAAHARASSGSRS
jgi:hypothetical protein